MLPGRTTTVCQEGLLLFCQGGFRQGGLLFVVRKDYYCFAMTPTVLSGLLCCQDHCVDAHVLQTLQTLTLQTLTRCLHVFHCCSQTLIEHLRSKQIELEEVQSTAQETVMESEVSAPTLQTLVRQCTAAFAPQRMRHSVCDRVTQCTTMYHSVHSVHSSVYHSAPECARVQCKHTAKQCAHTLLHFSLLSTQARLANAMEQLVELQVRE